MVADVPHEERPHIVYGTDLGKRVVWTRQRSSSNSHFATSQTMNFTHYSLANVLLHQGNSMKRPPTWSGALQLNSKIGDIHADHGYILETRGKSRRRLPNIRPHCG